MNNSEVPGAVDRPAVEHTPAAEEASAVAGAQMPAEVEMELAVFEFAVAWETPREAELAGEARAAVRQGQRAARRTACCTSDRSAPFPLPAEHWPRVACCNADR